MPYQQGLWCRKSVCASLVVAALALSAAAHAQDIRGKVQPAATSTAISNVIDLQKKTIFGVALGTTEDQFIAKYGPAVGYVRLRATKTIMLYGHSVGFVFESGKLAGVRLSRQLLDWRLANDADLRTPFSHIDWRLSNGIRKDSDMEDIKRILGKRLVGSRFDNHYTEDGLRIDLDLVTVSSDIDGKSDKSPVQKVDGIYIH